MRTRSLYARTTLLLVTLIAAAPAAIADDLAAFKAAIRAKYDLKEAAFRAHDADMVANRFYSEDVISVGIGDAHMVGRQQLLEEYRKHMSDPVRIESVHSHVQGDSGWDFANFHVMPVDPATKPFSFKMVFLWERRDGEWWCIGDMFMEGEIKPVAAVAAP